MVETAGMKLRRMRVLRQLSLADAARQTRISAARLGDLETDEYSNFPNLAYAKSFLRSYARFLNLDLRAYLDAFEDASTFGLDDYQYLSDTPVGVYRILRRPQRSPKLRRRSLVLTASVVGLIAVVVASWLFYVTYKRLGDLSKLADRQDARERQDVRADTTRSVANPLLPVSASPAPSAASPSPKSSPSTNQNSGTDLVADTLAQSNSPAILRTSTNSAASLPIPLEIAPADAHGGVVLSGPALQNPLPVAVAAKPTANVAPSVKGGPPHTSGFYVHRPETNSADVFRTSIRRPQNPAGNNLD